MEKIKKVREYTQLIPIEFITLLHYYAIGISFLFGAFVEEWISGRFLIKEPKGTKFVGTNTYLKKKVAIPIRIGEVIAIPLLAIPLSFSLILLLEKSTYYIFFITIIIANTIYFGTLQEFMNTLNWFRQRLLRIGEKINNIYESSYNKITKRVLC